MTNTLKNEFQPKPQRAQFPTLEGLSSALWPWIDLEYHHGNHHNLVVVPTDYRRWTIPLLNAA